MVKGIFVSGVEQGCRWQSSLLASARFWQSQNREARERPPGTARRKTKNKC